MKINKKLLKINKAAALIITVVVCGVAIAAAVFIITPYPDRDIRPQRLSSEQKAANAETAAENLYRIYDAQVEYSSRGLDPDTPGDFARFMPHLYFSVSSAGEKRELKLISKRLALAVGHSCGIDGYCFKTPRQIGQVKADYKESWFVLAVPAYRKYSADLFLLIDQSGRIYVSDQDFRKMDEFFPEKNRAIKIITSRDDFKKNGILY